MGETVRIGEMPWTDYDARVRDGRTMVMLPVGALETSLMLRLHPELVDMSKVPTHPPASFPPYDVYPVNPAWVPPTGALCSARLATAEKGEIFLAELERDIAKALAGEFKLPESGHSKARRAAE